jgi:hypothetical protein
MINLLADKETSVFTDLIADPNDQTIYAIFSRDSSVFTYALGDGFDSVVQRLREAPSIGGVFNRSVRGQYEGEKIQDSSLNTIVKSYTREG